MSDGEQRKGEARETHRPGAGVRATVERVDALPADETLRLSGEESVRQSRLKEGLGGDERGAVTRPRLSGPTVWDISGQSHLGLIRQENEDHFLAFRRENGAEVLATNLPVELQRLRSSSVHVLAVADGLGGALGGVWASRLALTAARRRGNTQVSWLVDLATHEAAQFAHLFTESVQELHENLLREAQINTKLSGMGTTLTVACAWGTQLFLGHVGDSRVYLVRRGELQQLTTDHTLAEDLIRSGAPAVAVERVRNVLTNSLGGTEGAVRAELREVSLEPGDQLLLCTDGLSDVVTSAEMLATLTTAATAADACSQLVERALARGGRDNITSVVARLPCG
ncbi:MAG: PP2C family protein-serine/threonine phosphatase [Planctomycetota bacterium]